MEVLFKQIDSNSVNKNNQQSNLSNQIPQIQIDESGKNKKEKNKDENKKDNNQCRNKQGSENMNQQQKNGILTQIHSIFGKQDIFHDDILYPDDISSDGKILNLADPKKAEIHRMGWQTGVQIKITQKKEDICPCCNRNSKKVYFSLKSQPSQFCIFGAGYPLLFDFIKFTIILLTLFFILCGINNLVTNISKYQEQNCSNQINSNNQCLNNSLGYKTSMGTKLDEEQLLYIDNILEFISIPVIIIIFEIFRYFLRKKIIIYDQDSITPGDYTIEINNVPKDFLSWEDDSAEVEIKNFFQNKIFNSRKLNVVEVNFCYKIENFNQLIQERDRALQQIFIVSDQYRKIPNLLKYHQEIYFYQYLQKQQEIENLEDQFQQNNNNQFFKDNFTGTCLVSFLNQQQRDFILANFQIKKSNLWNDLQNFHFCQKQRYQIKNWLYFYQNKLKIKTAAEPSQMIFQNIETCDQNKFKKRILVTLFSILTICMTPIIVIYMNYLRGDTRLNQTNSQEVLFETSISLILILINKLLRNLIEKITNILEKTRTTDKYIFFTQIYTLTIFLNSSVCLIITNVIWNRDKNYSYQTKIFGSQGLVDQLTNMTLVTIIITFLNAFVNLKHIEKTIIRWYYHRFKEIYMPQRQLNKIFQDPNLDFTEIYAQLFQTIFSTFFFASIFPLGVLISIFGLIIFYWAIQFNFVYRQGVQISISAKLSVEMMGTMKYCLPIFSMGNIIFEYFLTDISILSILGLGIGLIVNFILPMKQINQQIFQIKNDKNNKNNINFYEAAQNYFNQEYSIVNPATNRIILQQRNKQAFYNSYRNSTIQYKNDNNQEIIHQILQKNQTLDSQKNDDSHIDLKINAKNNQENIQVSVIDNFNFQTKESIFMTNQFSQLLREEKGFENDLENSQFKDQIVIEIIKFLKP